MAQAQNPKIEELRFRVKTDPKSRLFYPLAEELRKVGASDDAEHVLRAGLEHHPTYLSAWVSLGRVLRDQQKNEAAAEALKKALQLDPGNVVAARLLADAFLALGDKVEAVKKYKLVHALLPSDQDLSALIERLDREVNPPFPVHVEEEPPPPPPAEEEETPFVAAAPALLEDTRPHAPRAPVEPEVEHKPTIETPFAEVEAFAAEEQHEGVVTGDDEPMSAAHAESPFEETAGYSVSAMTVEEPAGFHVEAAPLAAEVPATIEEESPFAEPEPEPVADVFAPALSEAEGPAEPAHASDDLTNTITMADLYARQGLTDDARQIYENILERDPGNHDVRAKLDALAPITPEPEPEPIAAPAPAVDAGRTAKVVKLQNWLSKVRHV